jgi:phosphoribosylformylglycinamidine synthase
MNLEKQVQSVCRWGIKNGIIRSAHDCSEGGLAVALAECCLSSGLACQIDLNITTDDLGCLLFGEAPSRIIVSIDRQREEEFQTYLSDNLDGHFHPIGFVTEDQDFVLSVAGQNIVRVELAQMKEQFYSLSF